MPYVAASSGIAEGDFERLGDICENVPDVRLICLDVANGYSQFFVEYVRTRHMFSRIMNFVIVFREQKIVFSMEIVTLILAFYNLHILILKWKSRSKQT